jgi:tetratricopeptide (TPR) repeat protein
MTDFEEIVGDMLGAAFGAAIGVSIGLAIVAVALLLIPFLRARIYPLKIEKLLEAPALSPEQVAAAAELTVLGFLQASSSAAESGASRIELLLFRHSELPAFATLILSRDAVMGFPVLFFSFDVSGNLLLTTNRKGWLFPAEQDGIVQADAYAPNLAGHWRVHVERLSKVSPVTVAGSTAEQRAFAAAESYFCALRDKKCIIERGGFSRPTWRTALWQTKEYIRHIRKLIPRYVSAATSGDYQSDHDLEAYQELEAKEAKRSISLKVKAWLFGVSAVTSLALWVWVLGWNLAAALMIILAVHEAGHALAMGAFGYRNISMIFVPMLGAFVTGTPKQIPVWKQAIMLLAGPVPGFLLGAGALLYLKQHPFHAWGVDWLKVAALAAAVNLLNLLPVNPLDGGRLLEIGLFNRWARARLVFVVLSVAVIAIYSVWQQSFALLLFTGLLIGSLLTQRRIMKLQRAWREGLSDQDQIKHLFEVSRSTFAGQSFAQLRPAVKAVFTLRTMQQPRIWEGVLVTSMLLVLWSGAAGSFYAWKQRPDASVVSSSQLLTHSTAVLPCKNEGDHLKAARVCAELLDKGQLDKASQIMAYDKLAEIALAGSDYKTSLVWAQKASKANPGFPYHHLLAGRASAGLRRFDQAIRHYDAAIQALPTFFQAFHRRGEAYLALGDQARAREDFQTALFLDKDYKPAQIALAQLR